MVDNVSPEVRKRTMRAVRSERTKLEDKITKELWKRGYRFRRNVKDLPGNPDIAIKKRKLAIFIDSCFWHGCPQHCRIPGTNREYWLNKIERNKSRDKRIRQEYENDGWVIIRVWEHDIKKDPDGVIHKIESAINLNKA